MTNDYFEQYHRNLTDGAASAPRERAYTAQPRTAYRQSAGYAPHYTSSAAEPAHTDLYSASPAPGQTNRKKKRSKLSKGSAVAVIAICVLLSGFAGFGGSFLYSRVNTSSAGGATNGQINITRVDEGSIIKTSSSVTDKGTNEIVDEVADSVVEITTEIVQTSGFYGQYVAQGAGSGVIISEDGYILTNNHVIDGASSINVTLHSGDSYEAELIGTDADVDIALLKIDASGLSAATLGDSSAVGVGDKSVIIGNPLGTLGGSVTEGIVSAVDRTLEIDGKTMHLMQTDAAVNPGNSGGGMFNGQGALVGIVVAKSSGTATEGSIDNIGFVIPINNALDILEDLKEYGYVRGKASTGMAFTEGSSRMLAQYYDSESGAGVYVGSVEEGSNADKAGFCAGDRVISVDDNSVSSVSDLKQIISGYSAGDTVKFEIERSGSTGVIELTLEEYDPTGTA